MSHYIIKYPPNADPLTMDNWRSVDAFIKETKAVNNKVNSPTNGLSAVQGKVRINQYDSTAKYLEDKIVEGNDLDFVVSNDGLGSKLITANLKIYTSATAPASPTEGMLWYDTDEPEPEIFVIGDGAAGVDFQLSFDGETNDGVITWKEDEDYFQVADDVLLDETLTVSGATTLAALAANSYNIVCYDGDVVTYNDEVVTYG